MLTRIERWFQRKKVPPAMTNGVCVWNYENDMCVECGLTCTQIEDDPSAHAAQCKRITDNVEHRQPDPQVHGDPAQLPYLSDAGAKQAAVLAQQYAITKYGADYAGHARAALHAQAQQAAGDTRRPLDAAIYAGLRQQLDAQTQSALTSGALYRQMGSAAQYFGQFPQPPPEPIESTGIQVGEVIAWRVWVISYGWLYSVTQDMCEWAPGEVVTAHKVTEVMGDGIHAFKTRRQAMSYVGAPSKTESYAIGQVALWGQIYEFEKGWHGEHAKVHSIESVWPDDAELLAAVRKTYGINEPEPGPWANPLP